MTSSNKLKEFIGLITLGLSVLCSVSNFRNTMTAVLEEEIYWQLTDNRSKRLHCILELTVVKFCKTSFSGVLSRTHEKTP